MIQRGGRVGRGSANGDPSTAEPIKLDGDKVTYHKSGRVALVTIANPPVNVLTDDVWAGIGHARRLADADNEVLGVVVTGQGETFSAGPDVSSFPELFKRGVQAVAAELQQIHSILDSIENAAKPWVAAINGLALGGGLELALRCSHRICDDSAEMGLPELQLGIIPGLGGTQLLPRLVGVKEAVNMILASRRLCAKHAVRFGLVDHVTSRDRKNTMISDAVRVTLAVARRKVPRVFVSRLPVSATRGSGAQAITVEKNAAGRPAASEVGGDKRNVFAVLSAAAATAAAPHYRNAPQTAAAVRAIAAAVGLSDAQIKALGLPPHHALPPLKDIQPTGTDKAPLPSLASLPSLSISSSPPSHSSNPPSAKRAQRKPPLPNGPAFVVEMREFCALSQSRSCEALLYLFGSQRECHRVRRCEGRTARPLKTVAVVGSGLMGTGIAVALSVAGFDVILKDSLRSQLQAGMARAEALLEGMSARGRLTVSEKEAASKRLTAVLSYDDFDRVDMVVEAIMEKSSLKQALLVELEKAVGPDCILASNTSTIDLDELGENLDPETRGRFCGAHFFSPAHTVPLIEIVTTSRTSAQTIADVIGLAQRMHKTPVIVGTCPGFAVNRVFFPMNMCAGLLADSGVSPYRIDRVAADFGMPYGPFRLADIVGLDVNAFVSEQYHSAYGNRTYRSRILEKLLAESRLGKKSGKGFYIYRDTLQAASQYSPSAVARRVLKGLGAGGRSIVRTTTSTPSISTAASQAGNAESRSQRRAVDTPSSSLLASSAFAANDGDGASGIGESVKVRRVRGGSGAWLSQAREDPELREGLAVLRPVRDPAGGATSRSRVVAAADGGKGGVELKDWEVAEALFYPVVNEALMILEEGVVEKAGDLDIAAVFGAGFPSHLGGPVHWGQTQSFRHVCSRLDRYEAMFDHPIFRPCSALRRAAEAEEMAKHLVGERAANERKASRAGGQEEQGSVGLGAEWENRGVDEVRGLGGGVDKSHNQQRSERLDEGQMEDVAQVGQHSQGDHAASAAANHEPGGLEKAEGGVGDGELTDERLAQMTTSELRSALRSVLSKQERQQGIGAIDSAEKEREGRDTDV